MEVRFENKSKEKTPEQRHQSNHKAGETGFAELVQ